MPKAAQSSSTPFSNKLTDVLLKESADGLRKYFDDAFWAGSREKPTWEHLKIALLQKDKPKMRTLITWGAFPTNQDMEELKTVAGKEYGQYVTMLRQCGLRLTPYALELMEQEARSLADKITDETVTRSFVNGRYIDHRIGALPEEWLTLLTAVQNQGASEAVIGGGALRDLYNDRPVKDVDIFLVSRGSTKKNEKFLRKMVADSGFNILKKDVIDSYFGAVDTAEAFDQKELGSVSNGVSAESWVLTMQKSGQEYNFVFVGDPVANVDEYLENGPHPIMDKIIEYFDFGLCQIACDGAEISTTEAYRSDIKNKTITMVRTDTDKEHLERIVAKYPDWKLCSNSKDLLGHTEVKKTGVPRMKNPPPPPPDKPEETCPCGKPVSQCSDPDIVKKASKVSSPKP